jgi:amidophosphoribosyltransferase
MSLESLSHECAVIGAYHTSVDVAPFIQKGLIAMENRGRENVGLATFPTDQKPHHIKGQGSATEFLGKLTMSEFSGNYGVGHNRYGTTGGTAAENAQPFMVDSDLGLFAFAHNGNIFNAGELRTLLERVHKIRFNSESDSEVLAQLIANAPGNTFPDRIKSASKLVQGGYSYTLAANKLLIGGRDPHGIWPLTVGNFHNLGTVDGRLERGVMIASETSAFQSVKGTWVKSLSNGEMVIVDDGETSSDFIERRAEANCSFEYIYFHDKESYLQGKRVGDVRYEMGKLLAKEHGFGGDFVIPVPNTATIAARGYASESKIPFLKAINKISKHRTFQQPDQDSRERKADSIYYIDQSITESNILVGKDVVLVDDSLVRGTTVSRLVQMLHANGVRNVDMVIHAPVSRNICHLGIDISDPNELAYVRLGSIEAIRDSANLRNLGYLSIDGLRQSVGVDTGLCMGCFTNEYPMPMPSSRNKLALAR